MEFSSEFIKKLKKKEQKAFEALYSQTWQALLNYIQYRIRGSGIIAEDILSDVYCRAIEYSHTLTLTHNVTAWLFRITRSKIADSYRKLKREKKLLSEQKIITKHRDILNCVLNAPESAVIKQEDEYIIKLGFSRLPFEFRKVLMTKYIDEKSVHQIAAIIGKSNKAVENILYRARKLFKKEISKAAKEKIYIGREGGENYAGK